MDQCKYFMNGGCKRGTSCKFIHVSGAPKAEATARLSATLLATQNWRAPLPTMTALPRWRPDAAAFEPTGNSRVSEVELPIRPKVCTLRPDAAPFQSDDVSVLPNSMDDECVRTPLLRIDAPAFALSVTTPAAISAVPVTSPKLSWKPTIHEFKPATTTLNLDNSSTTICKYFYSGFCRNGLGCRFRHDSQEINSTHIREASADILKSKNEYECIRSLKGAVITFGPGAVVQKVELAADFSAVQITSLPVGCNADSLQGLLADLGFDLPQESMNFKVVAGESIVQVKVRDPEFAEKLIEKTDNVLGKQDGQLKIQLIQVGNSQGSAANRLRAPTLICTWSNASCAAWLQYASRATAQKAVTQLGRRKLILGRKIQCKVQESDTYHGGRYQCSVQLGNLNGEITWEDLKDIAPPGSTKITVGKPSHSCSDSESEAIIKAKLLEYGMESWTLIPVDGSYRGKAAAKFRTRERASQAVAALNDTEVKELANSKLHVFHQHSVKFSTSMDIFKAVTEEIQRLERHLKATGRVQLRSYPPADATARYISFRIYGEDTKAVANAKHDIDKILAGHVAISDSATIWDSFFSTAVGLKYLKDIAEEHRVCVHRDSNKQSVALYGPPAQVEVVEALLAAKVQEQSNLIHTIVLTPSHIRKVSSGCWGVIRERFGNAATLNLRSAPKTITILGSIHDLERANHMLENFSSTRVLTESTVLDCAVCWTEASEPYQTPCQHTYCTECFVNQCRSAGIDDLPVRCYGNDGKCEETFGIAALHEILPVANFEQLITDSFDTYIRSHPKEFQHCSTPDCHQIYRVSPNCRPFDCPNCLASICTTCSAPSHGGMSCDAYARLAKDGTDDFQKWKRENGIKECPKCKMSIEKISGCNHMTCGTCGAHICWVCLVVYEDGGKVYDHMRREHGGFG